MAHKISHLFIAAMLTYALGVVMMILAFAKTTDYHPPVSEYFVVPLLMAYQNPILAGVMLGLSLMLVHLCWLANARKRAC